MDSRDLVAQLGSEVAASLSKALDRVVDLAATGRIDRSGLRALRDEVDSARRAGIMAQQWVRLRADVTLTRERLDLTGLLRDALLERGREIEARGVEVRQQFEQADVISDSTLLFSFLQATLDWAFQHAVSRVDLRLDIKSWPTHARLSCAFAFVPADEAAPLVAARNDVEEPLLSTLSWRLLQQTAQVLGLVLQRLDGAGRTQLVVEFPETVSPRLETAPGLDGLEADDSGLPAKHAQPLAGHRVLVLAPRREVRSMVREALRGMGLSLEFADTVDDALQACASGLPNAMVYEQAVAGEEFELLRGGLVKEAPNMAFICITDGGRAFEVHNLGDRQIASVGRAAILESLPAALLFELARQQ